MAGEVRLMWALSGGSDRRLNEALRQQVPSEVTPGPGGLLGLELEFSARSQAGGRVHFGSLIHHLALNGSVLDPGDPNAYRCSWGGVITADGAEAEIATPPVRTRPGFTVELRGWAEAGQAELRRAVPPGIELDGYSAHISAAMPARLNDTMCRLYAETFAAGLMLMMDRADSPGLLVRPRPGRTELCGEFINGEALPAVAAFVAGTTRACAAAARRRGSRSLLPPRLDVELARAVHRYGWYVDRCAFGTDLHAGSRRVLLRRASGGTISAQAHLELAWTAACEALADDAAAADMQAAEAMVTGALPLPAEPGQPGGFRGRPGADIQVIPGCGGLRKAPALRPRAHVRPGFSLHPVAATWDFTVFEARGPARGAYLCVPRSSMHGFGDQLGAGMLDDAIGAYLAHPSHHRVLSAHEQTRRLGIYDQIGAPAGLLAPERDPQTGRYEPAERGAKHILARPGKRSKQEDLERKMPLLFTRRIAAIGVAAAVVLAGGGVAAGVLTQKPSGPPPLVFVQPAALSFPGVPVNASASRSLTVVNTHRSQIVMMQMRIAGPARGDFSVSRQGSPGSAHRSGQAVQLALPPLPLCLRPLQAGGSCTIQVTFTPSAPGPRTADLEIYFASRPQPQEIALSGTGIGPSVTTPTPPVTRGTPVTTPSTPVTTPSTPVTTPSTPVTTPTVPVVNKPPVVTPTDFGQVDLGQGPVAQVVTVTNPNPDPLPVTSVTITGDTAFTVATDSCSSTVIGPDGSCSVAVQFAPTALGGYTADLTVATTANPSSGPLTGTGIWNVNLTVNGPGSVADNQGNSCGSPSPGAVVTCTMPVTTSPVTLTETPNSSGCGTYGCQFSSWSSPCPAPTDPTCTIEIAADTQVSATFVEGIG